MFCRIDWTLSYFYYNIGRTILEWKKSRSAIRESLINLFEFSDSVLNKDLTNKEDLEKRVNYMLENIPHEHQKDANIEYQLRLEKKRSECSERMTPVGSNRNIKDVSKEKINENLGVAMKTIENLQDLRDEYGKIKSQMNNYDELKCASIFLTKEAIEYEEIQRACKYNCGLDQSEYIEIVSKSRPWLFKKCVFLELLYYKRLRVFWKLFLVL